MSEREILVDKLRLTYEGLFNILDLYTMIDEWLEEKGYEKREKKNVESVEEHGKYIEIEIEPYKKITDYAKSVIKIRMVFSDIKEVMIKKEGHKVKMNQGKIQMVFDVYLETDYENKWEGKPVFFFLRTIFDKFIFKPYTTGYKNEIMSDFNQIHTEIKSFLNLYRFYK